MTFSADELQNIWVQERHADMIVLRSPGAVGGGGELNGMLWGKWGE